MINATLGEAKPQKAKPFPKLMIHKTPEIRTIILAIEETESCFYGTCIATNEEDIAVGEYGTDWAKVFVDYNGSITLQNQ